MRRAERSHSQCLFRLRRRISANLRSPTASIGNYTAVSVGLNSVLTIFPYCWRTARAANQRRIKPALSGGDSGSAGHIVLVVWQTIDAGKGLRFAGDPAHTYRSSSDQTVHFHSRNPLPA